VRLLHFADLHLDAPFAWAGADAARARRRALGDALVRIAELASQRKVDAVCCAGDLYEQERFTPDTAALVRQVFADLAPIPVLLAPGNHDWLGPASLYRRQRWSANVHLFEHPRLQPFRLADGFTVWGAAHCAPANTPGFLDDVTVTGAGVHVALFHGSEQGELSLQGTSKVPHAPFRASQIPQAGLHHALVGHFHTPRDAPYHTYPGNPEPLSFGETGERGAVLVTVSADGSVRRERHRVAVSTVSDVTVLLDEDLEHSGQIRDRVAAALAPLTGTVRVTVAGQVRPDVAVNLADLADVAPHLSLVARIGRLDVAYDLEALARERTVRGQFVRDVQAAPELSEEQRRRVLVTGLRALDGRDDLAVR
jgi:DNA repair exonuclease SbcCD nuclease subunit